MPRVNLTQEQMQAMGYTFETDILTGAKRVKKIGGAFSDDPLDGAVLTEDRTEG